MWTIYHSSLFDEFYLSVHITNQMSEINLISFHFLLEKLLFL